MLASNNTPYAALGFEHWHRNGLTMAVIAVRATYDLSSDGALSLAGKQNLVLADEYGPEGPHKSSLLRVSDLTPFRPATDVTVLGYAYAPDDKPVPGWLVGVKVGGHEAVIRINGVRNWEPVGNSEQTHWKLGAPKPVRRILLDYRYAAGGRIIGDTDGDADIRNPLGMGVLDPESTPRDKIYPAPLIDAPDAPVAGPFDRPEPQGFGPVPPWWQWRERYLGTRDEQWLKETCPRFPVDFDYRFYQVAHPKLQMPGYLWGRGAVELSGLFPDRRRLTFSLPNIQPYALYSWIDGREVTVRLNLDGLHIDVREAPYRVDLTWRGWCPVCPQFFKIDLFETQLDDPALQAMVFSGAEGLQEEAA